MIRNFLNIFKDRVLMEDENLFIEKVIEETPALLTLSEGNLLFALAKNSSKDGVIVEIGSFKGGSTILLAKGAKIANKGKLYAIDTHVQDLKGWRICYESIGEEWYEGAVPQNTLSVFKENIKRANLEDWVIVIVKSSKKAQKNWNTPISLLWIDGDHHYFSVKIDYLLWEKKLIINGIIAFHDSTTCYGPKKVVEKYIVNSDRFKIMGITDSITVAEKIRKANLIESFINNLHILIVTLQNFMRLLLKSC